MNRTTRFAYPFLLVATCGLLLGCSGDSKPDTPVETDLGMDVQLKKPKRQDYTGPVWFDTVSDTGIDFVHATGNTDRRPFPAANGSGIAIFDYDLDGWMDLYFLTGRKLPIDDKEVNPPRNHLYRNRSNWKFEDISQLSGLDLSAFSAGVSVGDVNGDGFPDVYIGCVGSNALFLNNGDGTFEKVAAEAGADAHGFSASTAVFDFDHDGHLDLFSTHYAEWDPKALFDSPCGTRDNPQFCAPITQVPEIDVLLHSNGEGRFQDVTKAVGVDQPKARGQGVITADLNDDGYIDIYLGNDLDPNSLFANNGKGQFRNLTESSGGAYSNKGVAQASMGVDAADVDGDRQIDLIVTNFSGDYNSLYIAGGEENYDDLSARMGVMSNSMPYVGWGVCLRDFDLDTWCDLVVTNGHLEANRPNGNYLQPPLAWRNRGKGRFAFLKQEAGPHFSEPRPGRALACGDLDNDGDLDLVFGYQGEAPALLANNRLNDKAAEAASITVRLIGRSSNRDAIGADLLLTDSRRTQRYQRIGGGSYLSANDPRLTLAVNDSAKLEIRWPNQLKSTLNDLEPGSHYVIIEPDPTSPHESKMFALENPR